MARQPSGADELGKRLRLAREQAGLSQGQVASLLDMHRPTISEIEAGRRKVSSDELKRFAKLFDVDLRWLAGESGGLANPDDRVLLAARELAKLKQDDIDKVLKLLRTLRKSSDANRE
jgi:transcriptional regulator with XRE-family HTH domain